MSTTSLPEPLAGYEPPAAITEVLSRLKERGFRAFLVGGCVRDLLLRKKPKDFDVATSARPEEVQDTFRKVIPTGIEHGTVTVLTHGTQVEVTTFRKEGDYLDGRRPSTVEFHSEVEADLSRRDFTINAMAFDPVGRLLVDPFGGQADLAACTIRCVGAALDRFSEDGLRPLRAVRFAAVLHFEIEGATLAAIPSTLEVFRKVANERIREELSKLLLSDQPWHGTRLLRETGLLGIFLPESLEGPEDFDRRGGAAQAATSVLEVRLAALLWRCPGARDALKRLTFPTRVIEVVTKLLEHPLLREMPPLTGLDEARAREVAALTDAQVRRSFSEGGPALSDRAIWLQEALWSGSSPPARDLIAAFKARAQAVLDANPPLSPKQLALDGNAIMAALGVGPSRAVGDATRFLMDQVLEDPALNTRETLASLLRNWAKDRGL
ncbi:MAG TPA: [cytidine(C)-cytidine(C)-adenosine (A)]-adding enzyme [Myxococcaceae bacterium]|nr:[cytidine(C)-cytidine(C)-adenosine (A)]-adding enzyme [Myxococcaceae bacterium]